MRALRNERESANFRAARTYIRKCSKHKTGLRPHFLRRKRCTAVSIRSAAVFFYTKRLEDIRFWQNHAENTILNPIRKWGCLKSWLLFRQPVEFKIKSLYCNDLILNIASTLRKLSKNWSFWTVPSGYVDYLLTNAAAGDKMIRCDFFEFRIFCAAKRFVAFVAAF